MIKKIIIGCRSSKLSLAYTNLVVKQLKKKSILRSSKILIKKIKTKGDKFKDKKKYTHLKTWINWMGTN